jgi:hypothetical protein
MSKEFTSESYVVIEDLGYVMTAQNSGEATLMAVGADAPTKILKFSANYQIFTFNAPLAQIIHTPSRSNSSYIPFILL